MVSGKYGVPGQGARQVTSHACTCAETWVLALMVCTKNTVLKGVIQYGVEAPHACNELLVGGFPRYAQVTWVVVGSRVQPV